ncbi:MAG TPA: ferredoxin [Streptosporangiaceae bacterium]
MSDTPGLVIDVDRDRCCGSGNCASVLPEIFSQDDGGRVVLCEPQPAAASRNAVLEAVMLCPVRAITLRQAPEPG